MADTLNLEQVDLSKLPDAADKILHFGESNAHSKIFAFYGQMGAGKTTLIKEMCRQLGSHDSFSSPTYSLVNEYAIEGKKEKIYHLDLFRVKSVQEALDLGLPDYLTGENYCLIEWPESAADILPGNTVQVLINGENNIREMIIFMK